MWQYTASGRKGEREEKRERERGREREGEESASDHSYIYMHVYIYTVIWKNNQGNTLMSERDRCLRDDFKALNNALIPDQ